MELEGTVHNGVVIPDNAAALSEGARVRIEPVNGKGQTFGELFGDLVTECPDLPTDLAAQHDHYRLGTAKRSWPGLATPRLQGTRGGQAPAYPGCPEYTGALLRSAFAASDTLPAQRGQSSKARSRFFAPPGLDKILFIDGRGW